MKIRQYILKGYTNKTILLMDMYVADEKTIKMQF